MLQPKKYKFRKCQKGRAWSIRSSLGLYGHEVRFGNYGIKAVNSGRITAHQLESCRLMLRWILGRGLDKAIWLRVFPDLPITKKPAEVRMGKGKGNVDKWAVWIKWGQILYEMRGISNHDAIKSVNNLNSKLPIKVRLAVNHFRK